MIITMGEFLLLRRFAPRPRCALAAGSDFLTARDVIHNRAPGYKTNNLIKQLKIIYICGELRAFNN